MIHAALILLSLVASASASVSFPPATFLEQTYHFAPGTPFPQAVVWEGHVFLAYYERGVALGDGHYQVTLKLKEKQ